MSNVYGGKSFGSTVVEANTTFTTDVPGTRPVFDIDVGDSDNALAEFTVVVDNGTTKELHRIVRQLDAVSPTVVTNVFDTDVLKTAPYTFNTGVTNVSTVFTFNVAGSSALATWWVSVRVYGGRNVTIAVL